MGDARTTPTAEERLQALLDAVRDYLDALLDVRAAQASYFCVHPGDPAAELAAGDRLMRTSMRLKSAEGRLLAITPPRDPSHPRALARPTTDR